MSLNADQVGPMAFDIVTIVYAKEVPLLRLQARSLAAFFDHSLIGQIFIIVHDRNEDACISDINDILFEYRSLQDRVRVVRPSEIIRRRPNLIGRLEQFLVRNRHRLSKGGGWAGTNGWRLQQAFKLLSVGLGDADYVLMLDAKNHFLDQIHLPDLIDDTGKPRANLGPQPKKMKRWVQQSFKALNGTPPDADSEVMISITPFVIKRDFFAQAVDHIERRFGAIECYFDWRRKRTSEFMLLFAYAEIEADGWKNHFSRGLPRSWTVFGSTAVDEIEQMFDACLQHPPKFFGVHSRRIQGLPEPLKNKLYDIWIDRGLCKDRDDAQQIAMLNKTVAPAPSADA